MIVQLRIDDRLIHGQVVTTWSKYLDIDAIVVANDEAAKNDLVRKTLLMAASGTGKKVAIRTVEGAIELLSDARAKDMKVLLIVDCPQDACRLAEVLEINLVNVANFLKRRNTDSVRVTFTCYADPTQLQQFERLSGMVTQIIAQLLPTDTPLNFSDAVKKVRR